MTDRRRVQQDACSNRRCWRHARRPCRAPDVGADCRSKYWTPWRARCRLRGFSPLPRSIDFQLAGLERRRQQVVGGVEERRGVAARAAVRRIVARRKAATDRVMLARRPATIGMPTLAAAFWIGVRRTRRRRGSRNLLPGARRNRPCRRIPQSAARRGRSTARCRCSRSATDIPSVRGRSLEVDVRQPQAHPAPDIRLAACPHTRVRSNGRSPGVKYGCSLV